MSFVISHFRRYMKIYRYMLRFYGDIRPEIYDGKEVEDVTLGEITFI